MMKTKIILMLMILSAQQSFAQILKEIGNRAADAVERTVSDRVDRESSEKTDEVLDEVFEGNKDKKSKKKDKKNKNENTSNSSNDSDIKVSKNSDFVAGANVIFQDDFNRDGVGDFPAKWNSTGSGEVVKINGKNWFAINHNTVVNPELAKALPENSTIQFDMLLATDNDMRTPYIQFGLTRSKDILREAVYESRFYMDVNRYNEKNGQTVAYGLNNDEKGKIDFGILKYSEKIIHVDMAINKNRIRVYFDGEKIVDLPKALLNEHRNNFFVNNNYVIPESEIPVYITNVRIASGETDARSSVTKDLFETGTASTSDILFDSGKATLKSESYSILNDLGAALQQNSSMKVLIIGHTDSDGNEATNLTLSRNRAESVKNYLVQNFNISANRLLIDGKGESSPVASNNSADGKKQNRRVEFKKL